jgi:hypothetical protein
MAQDLKRIVENNFLLGYNDRDKPETLRFPKDGIVYMAMIKNGFVEEGKIEKRGGYEMIADAPEAKPILGQDRHEPFGGAKYILRARNNAGDTNSIIEGWSGVGNWTALTGATTQTADARHEFVTANNATYIFNDANDVVLKTTNGTTASTVAGIPQGIGGMWFHNFLFVYGVSTNPDRLYFSDIGTPETFDPVNGYIDVNPGDNEPITALAVLKDELLIFKASRVWNLTGFGTADFTLDDLGERITSLGTKAQRGVLSTGNDCYYISYQGSTPHVRSVRRTQDEGIIDGGLISDAITGTMKRVNEIAIDKTVMAFDGRRLWVALPMDAATAPTEVLVYDTHTTGWTRMTGIFANDMHISTITGKSELFFGSSEADGKSHRLNTGRNDDGDAIDFEVRTPYYAPEPGYQSRYKYLYLTLDADTASELDVDMSVDGFEDTDLATIDLTGLGAKFGYAIFGTSRFGDTVILKRRLDWAGGPAYYMQYVFKNNEVDQTVVMRDWEVFYQTRGLRATIN